MKNQAPPKHQGTPRDRLEIVMLLRWPLAFAAVALGIAFLAFWAYRDTLRQGARATAAAVELSERAAAGAERLARGLLSGNVTESFVSAIPQIEGAGSGRLELASAEATEILSREEERRILWDRISLGTTVSEIRVPVTYRYHLRLDDPWRLEVRDQLCVVYAPEIRPTLPPAIHTDRMEKRVEESWLRFDGDDQLAALERSLTPTLSRQAADPRHLQLVREPSRRTVAEFVRTWLLREGQWGEDRVRAIKVLFPDERTVDPERIGASVLVGD